MPSSPIMLKGRILRLHKSSRAPDFESTTVLCHDPWEFVAMWLKRHSNKDARFFWRQAQSFYDATQTLPNTSAPLTAYYCFLNATKCLLTVHNRNFANQHGVSGRTTAGKTSLANEIVRFQSGGTLAAMRTFLGDGNARFDATLGDLLYNLPYIHRAYTLTFSSAQNLYIPISNPEFVRKSSSSESWLQFTLPGRYAKQNVLNSFPQGWERDPTAPNFTVRRRNRFRWQHGGDKRTNLNRLTNYHQTMRREMQFISGTSRLWYLKRAPANAAGSIIDLAPLSITFAAMHKLSELARYTPLQLAQHFDCKHNWLLTEFISSAPRHFLDEIASEITGFEFLPTGIDSRSR